MKLLHFIFRVFINTYLTSADPNLFGSKKRREAKSGIADQYLAMSKDTGDKISELQSENPFEGAAAKAAMAKASIGAKQMQTRMLNTMGAGATPEAIIATQGATNQALGSAAGQIAAGAETNKANQIANLERLKTQQMGMYGEQTNAAEAERGSGWNTLFQGIGALGNVASGIGGVIMPKGK